MNFAWDLGNTFFIIFFFQAEDGIRDAQESRGLGDVYKRQCMNYQRKLFMYPNKMKRLFSVQADPQKMISINWILCDDAT